MSAVYGINSSCTFITKTVKVHILQDM